MKISGGIFDKNKIAIKLIELQKIVSKKDFWKDKESVKKILNQKKNYENILNSFQNSLNETNNLKELFSLASQEKNEEVLIECNSKIDEIKEVVRKIEISCFLSGENDDLDIFLEIHAGAGGTESQDWAQMLSRMYTRWIDNKNLKKSIMAINSGDEAGIKSITIKVEGENAFGLLKSESGVHRLVRISPFDAQKRRHTSFSSVWIYPIVSNDIEIEIDNKDLRIDTYRASGAGGQHVNKTDSAIRISHLPTGIVVQCQNQRSQHQNRASALKMLKSRLYELELRKIEEKRSKNTQEKKEIGWGHQIRSYVLQPYKLVKDLRTGKESSDIDKVLDGDLDDFIFSFLSSNNKEKI